MGGLCKPTIVIWQGGTFLPDYRNAVDYLFDGLENGIPLVDKETGTPLFDKSGKPLWESTPQPQHFAVRQYKKYKLAAGAVFL
ncbi:MAG: hypothetical protein FWB80_10840 [Defluviitaleaceae bacterium]|nr:hypothetical protein [Defluviitaleaceae bacterium]